MLSPNSSWRKQYWFYQKHLKTDKAGEGVFGSGKAIPNGLCIGYSNHLTNKKDGQGTGYASLDAFDSQLNYLSI